MRSLPVPHPPPQKPCQTGTNLFFKSLIRGNSKTSVSHLIVLHNSFSGDTLSSNVNAMCFCFITVIILLWLASRVTGHRSLKIIIWKLEACSRHLPVLFLLLFHLGLPLLASQYFSKFSTLPPLPPSCSAGSDKASFRLSHPLLRFLVI